MRKRSKIDVILHEGLGVFAETELVEQILNRLHRVSRSARASESIVPMSGRRFSANDAKTEAGARHPKSEIGVACTRIAQT